MCMQTSFDRSALIFLSILGILLVSPASAEWNIEVLEEPLSFQNVSNTSNTVQIVELTDGDNNSINESQLEGDSYLRYSYNNTTSGMTWLDEGYWYAEFELNNTGGTVEFEADGTTRSSLIGNSGGVVGENRTFNLGNISLDLMNDFSQPINPERTYDIEVNSIDSVNDTFEDQADVEMYITNGSWTSRTYNIDNFNDANGDGLYDSFKNFGLNFDLNYYSTYVLHLTAETNSNVGYENKFGTQSFSFETLPKIEGEVTALNASSGCNNESFFTECERDTKINTEFEITNANAENVNLTVGIWNLTSGEWENYSETRLNQQEDNDIFNGSVEAPDINTSAYDSQFRLEYNASNGGRTTIVHRDIDYRDFRILDKSDAVTGKGPYRVKLEIRKFFTPMILSNSRIAESLVSIEDPNGDQLTSFTVEDMDRLNSSGHFKRKINIPLDAETGIYELHAEVTNIYNRTKSETFNFNVTEVQQTFSIPQNDEDISVSYNKTGIHEFEVTLENGLASQNNLSTEVSGDIEDILTINEGEDIVLESEETRNVSMAFDIDEVDKYSGEVKFMDVSENYNRTVDVELEHPPCNYRNSSICVLNSISTTSLDERGSVTKEFILNNFGEKNQTYNYDLEISGNITEYTDLGKSQTVLTESNDSETLNITYTVSDPGQYEGMLEISNEADMLEIPLMLDANVTPNSVEFSLTDQIDLGDLQEGGSASADIEVENTGDVDIDDLSTSSDEYSVSINSQSISSGSTETLTLEFSEIDSESGEVNVTAQTEEGSISSIVSVSNTIVTDYGERADTLEQRVIDLDSQVEFDSEYQNELNNVQSSISDLRSAYRQGDYQRAETLNSQLENSLNTIEQEVASSSPTTRPGEQTQEPDQSGGIPILPIAAIIFVILIVGFIGYTSVEFEKGDPLYNVLGK